MKTYWIIIISLFLFTGTANSQSNKAYCAQEITWFGLDYSQAYFIDDMAFPSPYRLKDELFIEWNNFDFKEPKNFDIKYAFNKRHVSYSTDYINSRNSEADINKRVGDFWFQEGYFNTDSIQKIIHSYQIPENNAGIGLVFIVENLDKPNRRGIYWVTFFDTETKQVLMTEQIIGIPSGGGTRNYWANSFYNALIKSGSAMGFVF